MAEYIIRTFRGGVSDETNKGVSGAFKHGQALDIHKRQDSLSCKQSMSRILDASTGVLSGSHTGTTQVGIFNVFVTASDGTTYCFGSTGSIFARSGDGQFTYVYSDENGGIRGAHEWKLSDGNNYLFWATATSLARKLLPGDTPTPDSGTALWTDATQDYKTTLESADWHTMKNATGRLSIANLNALAQVDFDGNFNALALNLRPGNVMKTLEERDDYVVMGSGRADVSEEGHIWSWITTATNWVQKKRVPIQGVNALITGEHQILQGGSNGEIFLADFATPSPLATIPGGGESGPHGVAIENDLAIFGIYGGTYPGIWSYGRRNINRPRALNYEYRLSKTVDGSTVSTIGAVAVVDGVLLASWGTTDGSTSEYGIDSVNTTTKATAVYEGLEFDGQRPHLKKSFNTVKLNLAPLPSGTSVSVRFRPDKVTSGGDIADGWFYAVTGGTSTTFSTASAVEAIFTIGKPAMIYEVAVELNPSSNSTPEVLAITSYIEDRESSRYG